MDGKKTKGLFGYDYKLLFRRENARSEKIPPNALRYGRLSTSRLQLAGRVCTENQESEIAATISILCIAARPSRGFLVSEDKQALREHTIINNKRLHTRIFLPHVNRLFHIPLMRFVVIKAHVQPCIQHTSHLIIQFTSTSLVGSRHCTHNSRLQASPALWLTTRTWTTARRR